jgi:hypothetical protein
MRKPMLAGGIFTLALGLVGLVGAQDVPKGDTPPAPPPAEKTDNKRTPEKATVTNTCIQGKVLKAYDRSKLVKIKIHKILNLEGATEKDPLLDRESNPGLAPNQVVFIHVGERCPIVDQDGKSQKRGIDDDEGFDELDDEGIVIKVDLGAMQAYELQDKASSKEGVGGTVQAYEANRVVIVDDN